MKRMILFHGALAVLLSSTCLLAADDKTDSAEIKSEISKSAVSSCIGACHINFRKELGSTLGFLDNIGVTIHEARKTPDPVQLALCARGLAVAEKVSGKTAAVTSEQVMAEAVKLAKLRTDSQELAAVAALAGKDHQADLMELADVARKAEKAARAATEKGETNKALIGTLQVINHSHECLRIYMDGRYLGEAHAGTTENFHVHNHQHYNHFDAYCEEDGELVEHSDYHGHAHFLTWHIHN
ncbi:MAG: hypothetical protein R3C49_16610 [Planctomycetaceae bacterium]